MRRIALLAVAAALVATACDGGAEVVDSNPEEELVEAMMAEASANPDAALANPDRNFFDNEDAACVARGIVEEFGVDGLAELGVTPDNPGLRSGKAFVTPENGRRVVDVGMECISVPKAIVSFLPAGVTLLEESVNCLADGLQTDAFRDLFASIVVTGSHPSEILDNLGAQIPVGILLFRCLSAEEILRFGDLLN